MGALFPKQARLMYLKPATAGLAALTVMLAAHLCPGASAASIKGFDPCALRVAALVSPMGSKPAATKPRTAGAGNVKPGVAVAAQPDEKTPAIVRDVKKDGAGSTPAPTAPPPAPTPPPAPKPVAKGPDGVPLVTNVFSETDLRQALSDIGAQTGVTIIADSTVQGTVTADLKDVTLERSLSMLLLSGGFAFAKLDGYYLVGLPDPTNPNFYLLTKTEIVPLKHTSPQAIVSLLSQPYGRYLSAIGAAPQTVTKRDMQGSSSRSGSYSSPSQSSYNSSTVPGVPEIYGVIVTAPPSMMARIKADIAALDKAPSQIMLDAVVVELNQDALKDLGVDWATRWLKQDLASGAGSLVYSTIANQEMANLTALVRNGKGRLRANPRVATEEGQTAELEVGKESYFSIVTGPVTYPYASIENIKSGILLRITPRVIEGEGEVVARVEPEVRDVTGKGANGLPEITFRRATTNLRVKDGQSIVIGGLMNEFTSHSVDKVPVLGDIPLVGSIFRRTNTQESKTEVIIVVTPHIMSDTTYQGAGSAEILEQVKQGGR